MIDSILKEIDRKCEEAKKQIQDYEPPKPKYSKVPKTRVYNSLRNIEGRKPYVHSDRYLKARKEAE